MQNEINVLLLKDYVEDGVLMWSAQCLEHDIAAQGKTIKEALFELARLLVAEIAVNGTLENIPAAPNFYWQDFDEAKAIEFERRPPFKLEGFPTVYSLPEWRELRVT